MGIELEKRPGAVVCIFSDDLSQERWQAFCERADVDPEEVDYFVVTPVRAVKFDEEDGNEQES